MEVGNFWLCSIISESALPNDEIFIPLAISLILFVLILQLSGLGCIASTGNAAHFIGYVNFQGKIDIN